MRRTLAVLLLLASSAVAQQQSSNNDPITATPNRPTVTNTAETTQYGVVEIEYGVNVADTLQSLNGLLKFAAAKDVELRIAANHWQHDATVHDSSPGDTFLGAKWRFLHQKDGWQPTMSLQYTGKVPTASALQGSGRDDQQFSFLVSKDLTSRHHVDFNLNRNWFGRTTGGYDAAWQPTFTYNYAFTKKWTGEAEVFGSSRQNADTPENVGTLYAVAYTMRPRLVLDTAVQFGLTGRTNQFPAVTWLAGFTYSLADLYHPHRR